LDPEDRKEIRRNSGAATYARKPLRLSNGGSSYKKKASKIKPNKEPPNHIYNVSVQKQGLKRNSNGKPIKPQHKKPIAKTHEEINEMHFKENLKKPKPDIQLPGWRKIESPYEIGTENYISNDEEVEDMSDVAFAIRHAKAEEEEQMLWEKWQAKRLEDGKAITGRSKSSGWREPDLDLNAPRLRSQRVSSLKSECSTPGRLSPATVERVKEICVEPATPPYFMNSLHKAFDKHDLDHNISKSPCSTVDKSGTKLTMFETGGHKCPKTRIQEKFKNTVGARVAGMEEEDGKSFSGNESAEKSLLAQAKEIDMSSSLKTNEVVKKEQEDVIKVDPPNVRRSKSDTIGMRRSCPRDENENMKTDPNTIKNTKENIACQLMNLTVSSTENMKNSQNSINRLSESSCRSDSADAMNRVLKDSNVEKGRHVHQSSRQATKKTILSQKSIHRNSYTYPLRSQAMTRRTRQGVKR